MTSIEHEIPEDFLLRSRYDYVGPLSIFVARVNDLYVERFFIRRSSTLTRKLMKTGKVQTLRLFLFQLQHCTI